MVDKTAAARLLEEMFPQKPKEPTFGERVLSGQAPQQAEMRPYDPTLREQTATFLQRGMERLGADRYKARQRAETLVGGPGSNLPLGMGFADILPFVGTTFQTQEAGRSLESAGQAAKRGDYVGAAVEGGLGALGLVPGALGVARYARPVGNLTASALAAAPKVPGALLEAAFSGPLPGSREAQRGAIKMKGGNWLAGEVEKAVDPLKSRGPKESDREWILQHAENQRELGQDPSRILAGLEAIPKNEALDRWIDSNLTNYIKKQMATPEDPVRKLAEEGISQFPPGANQFYIPQIGNEPFRVAAGLPAEGLAKSELAKTWENLSDEAVRMMSAGDRLLYQTALAKQNPWLKDVDPKTMTYSLDRGISRSLGFDHIVDVLREDLATGRIRPEQLSKVSIEQAVRRTHQYDQELAERMAKATAAAREGLPVYKEYPEGLRWIELNKPGAFSAESDAMGHSVRGYEPPKGHPDWTEGSGDAGSLDYGHGGWEGIKSGQAKVYSLVDSKGAPHVTVEIASAPPTANDFLRQPKEVQDEFNRLFDNWRNNIDYTPSQEDVFAKTESLFRYLNIPTEKEITQIKGKQNRAPKEEYLPFVQDFVRSGNWSNVQDFQNTGLFEIGGSGIPWPKGTTSEQIDSLVGGMEGSNKTPKYTVNQFFEQAKKDLGSKYVTEQQMQDWITKQIQSLPEGKARGGSVRISDNPDTMRLESDQHYNKGGAVKKVHISDNPDTMRLAVMMQEGGSPRQKAAKAVVGGLKGLIKPGEKKSVLEGAKLPERTPEEQSVIDKFGQKQEQEAARAKKVEKQAKESAGKSPEESVKPTKSTGKRTAVPADYYRKMAEQQGDDAVLKAARAGEHLKPTSTGYVGAPRTVTSPQGLGAMRKSMDKDFVDAVEAVRLADQARLGTWYDRAKQGIAESTEPYQLPRTLEQHGVYSAGVSPESELTFALKHLNSRVAGQPGMAYRGAGMRTLDEAVAAGEPVEMGFKIGEYAKKNDPRLPNTGLFGVNDFRRAQGMGYTDPQGNPWKAGVSETMHPFMDAETALQVDRANKAGIGGRTDWQGPHIQEVPWVYGKAQDLFERGKTGRFAGDELEGIKGALQEANNTARDYFYKHAASATHEAIPGASLGHVRQALDMTPAEKLAYGRRGRWDQPAPESAVSEFPQVGAGNRDVIYGAAGYRQLPSVEAQGLYINRLGEVETNPLTVARPLMDFPTGGGGLMAPESRRMADTLEQFRAFLDAQEAGAYNLPNTGSVSGKNSLVLDSRSLNPNKLNEPYSGVMPTSEQLARMNDAMKGTGFGVSTTSRGAVVFPFDATMDPKEAAKILRKKQKELTEIYPSTPEKSMTTTGYVPGIGRRTPEGPEATAPFSGEATSDLLRAFSELPQSVALNISESEAIRQAIREKALRDSLMGGTRRDIQESRRFFSEADWPKAVEMIRKGMTPAAALAALGYSASSMAKEEQ